MNASGLMASVHSTLKRGDCTLDQLWVEHASLWSSFNWRMEQVSLWLACLPHVNRCTLPTGELGYALNIAAHTSAYNLADELVALLTQAGRPVPLLQLMGKLPAGRVVTEPMLRAIAGQDPRLELKGPLLKLI
jgi:hypothetical protein